ncbi:LysM peptidoglycan-binding domain-containing protein [Citricoccus sp. K5]|uniref:LysM peptidoglycan-binding domain-containing protein n=1 Tax=Citricoccus sp. K5 TaxID=2653135 RepID=UPI0012F4527D|nr:hypothetical protein [Citricoccus sp. K5]VXB51548.1 conserved membrane hypothetical protein [Citricoccus sp. K5]
MSASSENRRPALRGEDLVLTLLCTVAGPLLWWFGATGLGGAAPSAGLPLVERLVASLCAGAGAVVAAWWFLAVLGTALVALGHRTRSLRLIRCGGTLSPAFLRRVAASVLGVNLLLAPGAWATPGSTVEPLPAAHVSTARAASVYTPTALPHPGWLSAASASLPDEQPLPTPTWKPSAPVPSAPGAPRSGQSATDDVKTVTVRRGDCLWDIAAHELGPTATDLEVDGRWRQWHDHNRTVIGSDADVLIPGTVLTAPPLN